VSEQKYLMENKLTKQTNRYHYLHNLFSAKPNEGFARKTQHLRSPCYKMVTRRGGGWFLRSHLTEISVMLSKKVFLNFSVQKYGMMFLFKAGKLISISD